MSKTISNDIIHYKIPLRGIKFSTNKFYAGMHWTKRKEIKDSILSITRGFCRPIKKVKSYPVQIGYRFVFTSRALDTLNTAVMAKMFEDSLCTLGVIEGDSPKYVKKTVLEIIDQGNENKKKGINNKGSKIDKENEDYVEIKIYELK